MRIFRASLTALGVLLCGSAPALSQPTIQTEVVAEGLDYPWAVAELPGGDLLVTEKWGQLRLVRDGMLLDRAVEGVPPVLYQGQGGLLDVALHPDFETNRYVYLTWSEGRPDDNTLKLGRGEFDGRSLVGFREIFAATRRPTDVHYGGRLTFMGDGTLLLGIGDGFDYREQAQVAANHYGSFVHLDADGTPRPSPFENAAPGVYTIGHRNPQAVARDPETGTVYAHEHGPLGGDEINILERGANYGWPIASHGIDYSGALITPFDRYDGMVDPEIVWVPSIAPAGMSVYRGDMFPEWQGDLLVAALIAGDAETASGHLRRVNLASGAQEILLGELEARLRDVRVAADGSLLVVTDDAEGQLIRVYR